MATGTVKWFSSGKGFGFIEPDEGSPDVFAHYSAIAGSGYRALEENQKAEFVIAPGPKGPQAENRRPVSPLLTMIAVKRGIFLHEPIVPGS